MAKYQKYFLIFFLIILFFTTGKIVLAAPASGGLEIIYPSIPGLPNINQNNPGISEYVGYWFGLLIYLAGILSLISFTIGAIGLINPNPESHNDAKDRMKGALLGLVLTLASFVIIRTINPSLVTPTLTPLPGVAGVFLTNGSLQKPCPQENPDNSTIPSGFNTIQYVCSGNGPALLVWLFPNTNFGPLEGTSVRRITCGGTVGIRNGSFKMAFETPGIYYYLGPNCSGYGSYANTGSQNSIENPFNGKIKSVKIVNDAANDLYYGVIFHKGTGLENGGGCNYPIIDDGCQPVNVEASAADIFIINKKLGASGDGVVFYSEPFGSDAGAHAGFFDVIDNDITVPYIDVPWMMFYKWTNVSAPNQYQSACETFQDCPGSIKIRGSYLVALYSKDVAGFDYCQTFTRDAVNLNAQPIVASGAVDLDSVYIIPTK